AGRRGERLVPRAPRRRLLRGGPDRAGPGRGLRRAEGVDAGGGRAVALAEPRLRAGRGGCAGRVGGRRRRRGRRGALVTTPTEPAGASAAEPHAPAPRPSLRDLTL